MPILDLETAVAFMIKDGSSSVFICKDCLKDNDEIIKVYKEGDFESKRAVCDRCAKVVK